MPIGPPDLCRQGGLPTILDTRGARLKEKGFDLGKGAVVKAIVEVAGEEKNIDTLWDDSETEKPGGEFVSRMVDWIRTHKSLKETNRDDLLICATLSLGNICRRGTPRGPHSPQSTMYNGHSVRQTLIQPPSSARRLRLPPIWLRCWSPMQTSK